MSGAVSPAVQLGLEVVEVAEVVEYAVVVRSVALLAPPVREWREGKRDELPNKSMTK